MSSQINFICVFVLVTIALAVRLVIGALGFIFLVYKAVCSLEAKSRQLSSIDDAVYFNSINYPDELNFSPHQ